MKTVLVLTILLGAIIAVCIADDNKMKIINECKIQEKATDADIQSFKTKMQPSTPAGKCVLACAFEKNGGIKDGKIDPAGLKAGVTKYHDDSKAPVDDIVKACSSIANADRCELGFQLRECIHKNNKKN